MRSVALLLAIIFSLTPALRAQVPDASAAAGRPLAPFDVTFCGGVQMSPLPSWMPAPPRISNETATAEIPIPPLWLAPQVPAFALTVVFDDRGDGGPAVEWRGNDGVNSTISTGLGDIGAALGLNARTVLLPPALTGKGGTVLVSYYGKFDALRALSIRPARSEQLAVLGARSTPSVIDESLRVLERDDTSGRRAAPRAGDVRAGTVIEAELAAGIEKLDGELEFVVPLDDTHLDGTMLRLLALGLDLESRIDVRLNGIFIGSIGFPPFRLDDPALVGGKDGRPVLAGWRTGSLFIPGRLWSPGDNQLVLTVRRGGLDDGGPIFLKETMLHLRTEPGPPAPAAAPEEVDLSSPNPVVPGESDLPLPEIITGAQ